MLTILSLPSFYEHMKPILMYEKERLNFTEVAGKILSEEGRLKSEGRVLKKSKRGSYQGKEEELHEGCT